ncbi:MAG: hypothetical protein BWY80_00266 [Firmicutes bacterium ADurb.Bin456]|nr:MAG: hypothetical protein BWY80_00266 [Firmicutes bacterium ADurb.Bin456]
MKRLAVGLIVLLVIAVAGYKAGIHYVSQEVINKVAGGVLSSEEIDRLVQDPQVKKILTERLGAKGLEDLLKNRPGAAGTGTGPQAGLNSSNGAVSGTGNASGDGPGTADSSSTGSNAAGTGATGGAPKDPDGRLVFKTAEEALQFLLTKFSRAELSGFAAMAEGGVTPEEKSQIKAALMARLTPEEYQALKVIGLVELQKRQQARNPK